MELKGDQKFGEWGNKNDLVRQLSRDFIGYTRLEMQNVQGGTMANLVNNLHRQERKKLGAEFYTLFLECNMLKEMGEKALKKEHNSSFTSSSLKENIYCSYSHHNKLDYYPLKFTIPMVYTPKEWVYKNYLNDPQEKDSQIFIARGGGYLSKELHSYASVFNSRNQKLFNLSPTKTMVDLINSLNKTPYKINKPLLGFIENNLDMAEKISLIAPRKFIDIKVSEKAKELNSGGCEEFLGIPFPGISQCIALLQTNKSQSLRDYYNLRIAPLCTSHVIYFPVSADYRGRHYRVSLFNPQSDDLSKALIQFHRETYVSGTLLQTYYAATAGFFFKFHTAADGYSWFEQNYHRGISMDSQLFNDSLEDLAQAVSVSLELEYLQKKWMQPFYTSISFSLDAHASSYQLYGLLALDRGTAAACGIIPTTGTIVPSLYNFVKKRDLL